MTRTSYHAALALAALTLTACEKSPPPSAQPKNQGGLSGLADNPTSLPGRSAAAGREAARGIAGEQAQAGALADEVNGQASVITLSGVEFRPPTSWEKETPATKMQAAAYRVGNVQVAFLTGIGGSVSDNVERWKKAVTDPGTGTEMKSRSQSVGGLKVTLVTGSGTYSSMTSGTPTPQPDSGFRGAIVEAPGGLVFVRMTGPEAEVVAATPAWEQLVLGVRKP